MNIYTCIFISIIYIERERKRERERERERVRDLEEAVGDKSAEVVLGLEADRLHQCSVF
jgi:hypothetical protein